METRDNDGWLRDRNRQFFGVDEGSFGTAWKEGKVGNIYKDESYYIEPDFGWLGKLNNGGKTIIGGQNMKSKISGIGLRITKIDGEPIWGRDRKVKWNDLRGNNGWKESSKNEIEGGRRTISVQRAAYYEEGEGPQKKIVDLGQGVCMLKLPRDEGNVYLIVGVAKLGKDLEKDGKGRRVGWDENSGFSKEGWQICYGVQELIEENLTLNLNWFEPTGEGNIRVDKNTVITIGDSNGVTRSWKRKWDEAEKVAVVLGVAVKCSNWSSPNAWRGDEYKCKKEGEGGNWIEGIKSTGKIESEKNGEIALKGKPKWEYVGSYQYIASAKYTWTNNK